MARYGRGESTSRGSLVTEQCRISRYRSRSLICPRSHKSAPASGTCWLWRPTAPCGPGVRTTRASESHAVTSPPKVSELSTVTQVSAGNDFSLAVSPNGTAQGGATTTSDSWVRATNSRARLLARAVAATGTRGGATAAGRRLVLAILSSRARGSSGEDWPGRSDSGRGARAAEAAFVFPMPFAQAICATAAAGRRDRCGMRA
jgi:hypothetical protein